VTKIVKFGKLPGFWNDEGVNDEGGNEESHNEIPWLNNILRCWEKHNIGFLYKAFLFFLS